VRNSLNSGEFNEIPGISPFSVNYQEFHEIQ